MANISKQEKEIYEEYGVASDEELNKILENDWQTIPCMGGCGTPIFVSSDKIVWVFGDPYHKGCV